MQRYFALNINKKNITLESSDYHHIINVMRMNVKDKIEVVFDNIVYLCEITSIYKQNVDLNILETKECVENKPYIILAIPLVKEQKMDFILQKSTELGVNEIIPVQMERCIVKETNRNAKKKERWRKICKEASEQSFRTNVPKVCDIVKLKDLCDMDSDLKIVCSTSKLTFNIKNILQKKTNYDKILVVIGPEGGISEKEEELLSTSGFIRVSLGKTILRVETAPIVFLSMLNYEIME